MKKELLRGSLRNSGIMPILTFLAEGLIPYVDANFRIPGKQGSPAIDSFSMYAFNTRPVTLNRKVGYQFDGQGTKEANGLFNQRA